AVLFVGEGDPLEVLQPCLERGLLPVHVEPGALARWGEEDLARFRAVVVDETTVPEGTRERLEAAVADGIQALSAWEPGPAAGPGGRATLAWTRPSPTEVQVHVRTEADGWLEVAESWYPHWGVEVDGRPARLLRTSVAFQGVWVPAGEHEVRFVYRWPAYLWGSLALSGLGWLACLGGSLWGWRRGANR
ncbi:MAG: hypothetical protein ACP5UM_15115, partial [Anaerolineae bacterium]